MGKRKADEDDFDLRKDTILGLYQGQKKTLPEVIAEMTQSHGFKRSPHQYREAFKKWGSTKNITKAEWECILSCLRNRESLGKSSKVEVRGTVVCTEKIRKQRKLHEFRTTYEKLHLSLHTVKCPEIPAYVRVFTPEPSPTPILESWQGAEEFPKDLPSNSLESSLIGSSHCRKPEHCASVTPWQEFLRFMTTRIVVGSDAPSKLAPIETVLAAAGSMSPGTGDNSCGFQRLIDDILSAQYLTIKSGLLSIYENPYPYLPHKKLCNGIDMNTILRYTDSHSKLELLKLTVYGMSNNFDTKHISSAVMDLAREHRNLLLIETLLGQRMPTTQAFAEKLFMAALPHDNLPLLRVVVESDAIYDLTRFAREDWHFKILGDVLGEGDVAQFKNLLAQSEAELLEQEVRKASARGEAELQNCCRFDTFEASTFCRDIDLNRVVCSGDYMHLEDVLRLISRHTCPHLHPTIYTLRLAVLQGRLDLADLLMKYYSNLLNEARMEPWLLLEAASLYGDIDVFDRLMAKGLDPCATDERGLASPLAAACLYKKKPLVRHLLQLGMDVNGGCHGGTGHSTFERTCRIQLDDVSVDLKTVEGLTALHVAVLCEDVEAILLLLSYGADAKKWSIMNTSRLTILLGCQNTGLWYDRSDFADWICDDFRNIEVSALQLAFLKDDYNLARLLDTGSVGSASATPPLHSGTFFNGYRFVPRNLALASPQCYPLEHEIQTLVSTTSSVWGTDEEDELGLISLVSGLEFSNPASNSGVNSTQRRALSDHELKETLFKVMTQIPDRLRLVDDRKHYLHAICDEAARSGNLGVIQTVLDDGLSLIDSDLRYNIAISTLIQALQARNSDTVAGLVNLGTDPNIPINCSFNRSGLADALQFAALQNDLSLVELLIAKGANVNASPAPEAGATALQFAARNGNFDILETLLAAGAELNALPSYHHGMSAIEGAAAYGRLDMVRYLLECGADVQGRKNLNYRRTVYRAWSKGHKVLVDIIQDWKMETYGPEDVESTEVITKTLKQDERNFSDLEAVTLHARYGVLGDIYDLILAGVGSWTEVAGTIGNVEGSACILEAGSPRNPYLCI